MSKNKEELVQSMYERFAKKMGERVSENYGMVTRYSLYYFPRYNKYIIAHTCDIRTIAKNHDDWWCYNTWYYRYFKKKGIDNVLITHEMSLAYMLNRLEEMKQKQEKRKIVF